MNIKVRKNVFETNSSSTHSICITRSNDLIELPKELDFITSTFGWENNVLNTPETKASYLYTAILELSRYEMINKEQCIQFITDVLYENNISCTFINKNDYYIDHFSDLIDFVKLICHSERRLLRYLFSNESFIITGNDNDDSCININVPYKHEEYFKGN